MKTSTRNAAAVAGIAILLGTAGGGTLAAQGQAKQQLISDDAVIRVSSTSPDHHGKHRTTHRHQNRSAQEAPAQIRTAEVGVEAAADAVPRSQAATESPQGSGVEVVLKSLPGLDSDGESCS
ncbi:hypothetical protein [Arthrobacter globiformis]|jgi:hypothetical protein|uniref:Secreted protein n=2 Tax=Arthrobacter TaxID=1663 RepID=H0QU26_ARTG1|nr:hypothetical protein [Arthrobacter globiformis]GAB16327.1 hypothetical protein ARGLB_116_00690 [Arthrobacter globiformis NBRC 12137]